MHPVLGSFNPGELLIILAVPFVILFGLWMLIDAITSQYLNSGEKLGWVLAIFFLPCLGAILYYAVGRKRVA